MDPTTPVLPRTTIVAADQVQRMSPADLQQMRWGPVWAGFFTALGIFILLSLAAIAAGLQASPGVPDTDKLGWIGTIVASAIALVSFFVGGYVAAWSAGVADPGRGLLNGFLVWSLFLVAILVLTGLGLAGVAGSMAQLFDQVTVSPPDVTPDRLADVLRQSSWQSLLALALTAASAALGGVLGAREDLRTLIVVRSART
jgi:hypothetical protein